MKQISGIDLAHMNNGAHFLFMTNVLERAETNEKVTAKAANQVTNLKAAMEKEDEYLKLSRKSLITDEIAAADAERDTLYSSYKATVGSFLKLPSADMAKAAKVLNQHLIDYAISPRMQLDRETGLLINLITDLEEKYKAEVELLSLTSLVSHLKAANERLRSLTGERTDVRTGNVVGALKAARKVTDDAYRALVQMINALAVVEGDADYAKFIDYVNTEITHYKREVLGQSVSSTTTTDGSTTTTEDDAPVVDDGSTDEGGGTVSEDDIPEVM